MSNMVVIDWGKIPWRKYFPWVNEGRGLTELRDVTLMERWIMTSRGDEVCQIVRGDGIWDEYIHAMYR